MENNLELLPLTDDYIFKRVFAYKGNESVLKDFLEALLKIEIKGIKITNPEIIPYEKGEKRGLLDIKAEINDETMIDVELQMKNEKNTDAFRIYDRHAGQVHLHCRGKAGAEAVAVYSGSGSIYTGQRSAGAFRNEKPAFRPYNHAIVRTLHLFSYKFLRS